jgi:hypothetical protein
LLVSRGEPYLVQESRLSEVRRYLFSVRATSVDVEIGGVNGVGAVVDALKVVLPFPDWCASGWDSIEDAFEEIRQGWSFPLVVVVHGLRSVLDKNPHLAFETVIRMSWLSHAFSTAGDQMMVTYVDRDWG